MKQLSAEHIAHLKQFYNNPQSPVAPVRYYQYPSDRMQRYTLTQSQVQDIFQLGRNELIKLCDRNNKPLPHCVCKRNETKESNGRYFDPKEVKYWLENHLNHQ